MHALERFPHSLAIFVDDITHQRPGPLEPVLVGSVNAVGDAIVNQDNIGTTGVHGGQAAFIDFLRTGLDGVVNANAGVKVVPPVPSNLKGRVQLQLAAPTLQLSGVAGANVTAHLNIMARYFPDPQTSRLAEFVRGTLQLTVPVSQVGSQTANVVTVNIRAQQVAVSFTPLFSSSPVSPEDLAGVNLLIRNTLQTSFMPSSSTLPSNIRFLQFKTISSGQNAIALLLNLSTAKGNPATLTDVFLGASDHFALAASADFIRAAFQPALDRILATPIAPIHIDISILVHTFHVTYTITLHSATVALQAGAIVLTITGHAHSDSSVSPSFDFTATQKFTLQPDGSTADLVVGDLSLDTSSEIVNIFNGTAVDNLKTARDQALNQSNVFATVRQLLSADANLGSFLRSMLAPPTGSNLPPAQPFALAYTSVAIQPAGIVLHGSLGIPAPLAPRVEFEKIPSNPVSPPNNVLNGQPQYSALQSWIPGGGIQQFEWNMWGQPAFDIDHNKFVLQQQSVVVASAAASVSAPVSRVRPVLGYSPLCLTIRGTRLSSSGPVIAQPVSASACAFGTFPVLNGLKATLGKSAPMMPLTQSGPDGHVEVTGHTAVQIDRAGNLTPNLIVHFADANSAAHLEVLAQALEQSKRTDAPTAILAVMSEAQLGRTRFVPGITFADDKTAEWEKLLAVQNPKRPSTLLFGPTGHLLFRRDGPLDAAILAPALAKLLVARSPVLPRLLASNLTLTQRSPNFLFDIAPDNQLTLRKLTGRSISLLFWRVCSPPSIDALLDLQGSAGKSSVNGPVLLTVNDGDSPSVIAEAVKQYGLTATIVPDPQRDISSAYGITVWPTTISLDALGSVRSVRYARSSAPSSAPQTPEQARP